MLDKAARDDQQRAREIINSVFLFVESALPASLRNAEEIRFRTSKRSSFDAYIPLHQNPGIDVVVNLGLIDAIYAALVDFFSKTENEEFLSPLASYDAEQLSDVRCRNIIFTFALSFACFHEAGHIAGGHVERAKQQLGSSTMDAARLSFSEVGGHGRLLHASEADDVEMASDVSETEELSQTLESKIAELEADSVATEFLVEFAVDIVEMLVERDVLEMAHSDPSIMAHLDALLFCGIATVLVMIEVERSEQDEAAIDYPTPATRLLNIFTTAINWHDRDRQLDPLNQSRRCSVSVDTSDPDDMAGYVATVVLRTLAYARGLGIAVGQERALTRMGLDAIDPSQGFLGDLLQLLRRMPPHGTLAGREISALNEHLALFQDHLSSFRQTNWWTQI